MFYKSTSGKLKSVFYRCCEDKNRCDGNIAPYQIVYRDSPFTHYSNHTTASSKSSIVVFPNPTADMTTLKSLFDFTHYEIIDVLGSIKEQKAIEPLETKQELSINFADFQPGIYFVRVLDIFGHDHLAKVIKL